MTGYSTFSGHLERLLQRVAKKQAPRVWRERQQPSLTQGRVELLVAMRRRLSLAAVRGNGRLVLRRLGLCVNGAGSGAAWRRRYKKAQWYARAKAADWEADWNDYNFDPGRQFNGPDDGGDGGGQGGGMGAEEGAYAVA